MNDLILFWNIHSRFIPLDSAHVTVKRHSGQIVGITTAEEAADVMMLAIFRHYIKGFPAKTQSFVRVQNIKIIQTKRKIFIRAIIVRAKGKVAHAALSVHEQIIRVAAILYAIPIP